MAEAARKDGPAGAATLAALRRDAVRGALYVMAVSFACNLGALAVPLYNFGVSQHLKTWVDLVITDPRMAPGQQPPLAGKPAVLVTVHGGNYSAGTPREGWDHATPWMRRILADLWGLDLTVTETDFTLVGVNPALDQFKELAAELRAESERVAREHGANLGRSRRDLAA